MTSISSRMPEPEHGHTEGAPHHEIPYMKVFGALVVLTVVTVAVALYRFEVEIVNVLLALAVASVKGSLVALYFMHLKYEGKLIYLIFIVPLCLCVLLVCALIPDIVLTNPETSHSSSLKMFNPVHLVETGAKHH
ncbi:MAG: cytochrome C oxidase subunit IV family protein [Anaerolineae bacterium]|nr:cytochrome C oxidase subunit IV family protein [Phycisphaerae bacterium]